MLPGEIAAILGLDVTPDPDIGPLVTRFGQFYGRMERLFLTLIADEGQEVQVDATFFVCSDWHYAMVVGWRGCLERIRFGLDPSTETCCFYFARKRERGI